MTTGGKLNLKKPNLNDDWMETMGTDLPANFQKIDDEFTALYSEGDWTPILYGQTTAGSHTYSVQAGKYIKINKKVTCYGNIRLSVKDTAMAGSVRLGGLPFTVGETMGSISFGYIANVDFGTGELFLHGYPVKNTTRMDVIMAKDNTSPVGLQPAAVNNNTELLFTIEYITTT